MRTRLLAGLLVLALVGAGSVGGATVQNPAATDAGTTVQTDCNYAGLYDAAADGVVRVNASNATDEWAASGWVVRTGDAGALVVTNWHVVYGATDLDAQFGERWREAELVGADAGTDLAVLRVPDAPASARPLPVATDPPERGQPIAVLGSPYGLHKSITRGIVSGVERAVTIPLAPGVNATVPGAIQTDAAVEPGNSGGPWLDCRGRVVGMTHGGYVYDDVTFGVPARLVRQIVPELVANGSYDHPYLGVSTVSVGPQLAEVNDLDVARGAMVVAVAPGGPADGTLRGSHAVDRQTGRPYGGDVILAVDGVPVADRAALASHLLAAHRPNDTVELTVRRDGANRTVRVTLGVQPPVSPTPAPNGTTASERPAAG